MLLVKPATYLDVATFKAQPNDQDLTKYSDTQLTDILVRASGVVDGICNQSFLPREVTEEFEGNGTNELDLGIYPLIYVKSVSLVMPGFAPFQLPIGSLMFDYARGTMKSWSPMIWRSLGVANVFPRNGLPIVATFAYGYGYPIPPPSFTLGVGVDGSLANGTPVNVAVSTRTQAGESLPTTPQAVTPTLGGVQVTIVPIPGAYVYRVYASTGPLTTLASPIVAGASSFTPTSTSGMAPNQKLTLGIGTADVEDVTISGIAGGVVTTSQPITNAHAAGNAVVAPMQLVAESPATNFGTDDMVVNMTSLAAPENIGIVTPQTTDSSGWELPTEFIEATRIIALSIIWEQNNLANRGVYSVQDNSQRLMFRSTEGTSGRGVPLAKEEAADLLSSYVFGGVY